MGAPLTGPAANRGDRWAEEVVRKLLGRWPSDWPRWTPKAIALATRHVLDLHGVSDEIQAYLARVCLDAARTRYLELREFLEGKRLTPPQEK